MNIQIFQINLTIKILSHLLNQIQMIKTKNCKKKLFPISEKLSTKKGLMIRQSMKVIMIFIIFK